MYKKQLCCVLLFFLILTIAGCDKLSKYDLSGQIEMGLKTDGSAYREIYEFYDYSSDFSDVVPTSLVLSIISGSRRSDTCDLETLFIILEFMKDLPIGGDNYTIKVDFVENPPQRFNFLQILDSQGAEIPLTVLKEEIRASGGNWINLGNDWSDTYHIGDCLASFIEPVTNKEYLVEICHDITCVPRREDEEDEKKYASPSSVRLSIEAKIGNPHYLQGTLKLSNEESVSVLALDWDLDGIFTNNDRVRMDGKDYPLNRPFKIGKGKKEKEYIITLEPVDDEGQRFVLSIKRTTENH